MQLRRDANHYLPESLQVSTRLLGCHLPLICGVANRLYSNEHAKYD